ncbi:MAG: DUF302 domain-containing protein [Thiobacillus sp.]|uniref:DUF302 domain-containing protein n=1 Tax=Thiobacillus sp. TaxID=924 RepID=UPI0028939EE7|nr:DUF302 domain-containing protein [Thiobacillus sp.]MDT3708347.1 DUF302 domain-containing protein [Thiobacillus sp.]
MKRFLTLCALASLPFSSWATDDFAKVFKTEGEFQYVRDAIEVAIEGKGIKINHTNKIAEMLERTGKDLGATKQVYVNGEQFEFCSAVASRRMMEADPNAMTMCPYIVSVYTLPNDKHVYIAYRKPPLTRNPELNRALADVEKLLEEIIQDAM